MLFVNLKKTGTSVTNQSVLQRLGVSIGFVGNCIKLNLTFSLVVLSFLKLSFNGLLFEKQYKFNPFTNCEFKLETSAGWINLPHSGL